jgi:conjugative coupling factor TraD (TOL family)
MSKYSYSNSNYPIHALLRPPVEMYSAFISAVAACLLAFFPMLMMTTPQMAYAAALCLELFSIYRSMQGYQIINYQKNLKRLPYYSIESKDIPISHKKLFLGKGFRWTSEHTQRLYDCKKLENLKYSQMGRWYRRARKLEINWENKTGIKKQIVGFISSQHFLNPVKPLPPVGGSPLLHGIEPNEEDVWMNLSERVGHMITLGTTRVGKTRFLEILATQDIRRGDAVIVFDPKGDGDLLRRIYAESVACGREKDLLIFHLGHPESSARYNPIGSFARITEVANRVSNQLPGTGESAAFKEFAWRFVNIIAKTLVELGRKVDYRKIQRYILNVDPLVEDYCNKWLTKIRPNWSRDVDEIAATIKPNDLIPHLRSRSFRIIAINKYIEREKLFDSVADGLFSAFNYDKTYFDKITASLLPLIEKLTTGQTAELLSPDYFDLDEKRPIFDWMQVIKGKKIVYIGLDAMSDATVATAVGSSMFSDLCSVAGQLYKFGIENKDQKLQHKIAVYADEFNEIANDDVTTVLNKGGGAGFQMTLFTQTWSDVEVRLGTAAKAGQVGGNLNTIVSLRVLDDVTAKYLTNKLPQKVSVYDLLEVSSVTDSPDIGGNADFTSSNEDRIVRNEIPMLTPNDLLQLPKGQAFILIEGGQLYKIRIPLTKELPAEIPETIEAMVRSMQADYKLEMINKEWWKAEITKIGSVEELTAEQKTKETEETRKTEEEEAVDEEAT